MVNNILVKRHAFEDLSTLTDALAQTAGDVLNDAIKQYGKASLVVPGGTTPAAYLPKLAQTDILWRNVFVTLSDERWVDSSDKASNERLIRECFLHLLGEQPQFISLKTLQAHPAEALAEINKNLLELPLPFNLTLLGMGEDGHVASLFPGMELNISQNILCQVAEPPAAPSLRVSLSLRVLAASHHVFLVVTGQKKRRLIDRLIETPDESIPFVQLSRLKTVEIFETD